MEAVIPDLAEVARSYAEFRAVAGVGAVSNEADYDRALALIEAIHDEPATHLRERMLRNRWLTCWTC